MSDHYSWPSNWTDRSGGTRMIEITRERVRMIVAMFMLHDDKAPGSMVDVSFAGFAANLVLRGTGRYVDSEKKEYPLKPGTLFHRFPGRVHSSVYDPGSRYCELFIVIDEWTSRGLLNTGLLPQESVMDIGIAPSVLREFKQLARKLTLPAVEISNRVCILETLRFLDGLWERARIRAAGRDPAPWLPLARQLLERSLNTRQPLEDIARELGFSYASFRKKFRQVQGVSPGSYRIGLRMQRACHLLATQSVKQVAAELGYKDLVTFSTQFKAHLGVSPRSFKRNLQQGLGD